MVSVHYTFTDYLATITRINFTGPGIGYGLLEISTSPTFGWFRNLVRSSFWPEVKPEVEYKIPRTVQRSVTIQTVAKRGYRLFGQWNVYVNLLHIRNVSLRNCHICYVTFWIYTVSVCLFSSFFQVISLQETSSFSSMTHNWWVMSIYLFDRLHCIFENLQLIV